MGILDEEVKTDAMETDQPSEGEIQYSQLNCLNNCRFKYIAMSVL